MSKRDMPEQFYLDQEPNIADSAFVAKGAQVMGAVELKSESSVWYNAVLRGDINRISVGERSNIQDGSVLHVENDRDCVIGNDVTVGHGAIVHGCTIEDGVLIGMGAVVLNGAVVGKGSVIGAGAVVKENMIVEENSLLVGVPARVVRALEDSYQANVEWAAKYVQVAARHRGKFGSNR